MSRKHRQFTNPVPTEVTRPGKGLGILLKFMTGGKKRVPGRTFVFRSTDDSLSVPPDRDALCVTWIGHSTVVLDIDGKRFITDPIWSSRCSPLPLVGPVRFFDPPVDLNAIKYIDGVIISHDHYDHLDEKTIIRLGMTGCDFFVPIGVRAHLEEWGIHSSLIHEFTWGDERRIGDDHVLIAEKSRHFSGRKFGRRNDTLWVSWVIQSRSRKVFFGGDGGYFKGFSEIGKSYGPFDLTILEIGAYDENWKDIHMGPVNALKAHHDLGGKVLFPVHWGTFSLAFHPWNEPINILLEEAEKAGVKLLCPEPGETVVAGEHVSRWWDE
ncbi:MAG TPA: MBL fold metallo-hydrolase [Spirochaetota bacterium]|nr:MBL fold metallo-hydrolase [Spirochaetota bacterium]